MTAFRLSFAVASIVFQCVLVDFACNAQATKGSDSPQAKEPTPRSERTLDYWAGQLSHPRYLRRQSAQRYLVAGGRDAIPVLRRMIDGADLETAESVISVLAQIAKDEKPWRTDGAISMLESIADSKFGAKATLARSALNSFAEQRGQDARIHLDDAGVSVRTETVALGSRSSPRMVVRIDQGWNGDVETLAWLRWVGDASFVMIESQDITPEMLEAIIRMPKFSTLVMVECKLSVDAVKVLQRPKRLDSIEVRYIDLEQPLLAELTKVRLRNSLFLMGTGLSDERVERLKVELPGLEISHRRGGFLGVLCRTTLQDTCEVSEVIPGSGAEDAGLRAGDTIIRIDERKITRFEDLQRQINTHIAGDELSIRYRRNGEVYDTTATLKKQRSR